MPPRRAQSDFGANRHKKAYYWTAHNGKGLTFPCPLYRKGFRLYPLFQNPHR